MSAYRVGTKFFPAALGLILMLPLTSDSWGLSQNCTTASPQTASSRKIGSANDDRNSFLFGLNFKVAPVDLVAAARNYEEMIHRPLDFTSYPTTSTLRILNNPSNPRPSRSVKKVVSYMPILIPNSDTDRNMPIKKPDPSIDYKLIVKAPDIESVQQLKAR